MRDKKLIEKDGEWQQPNSAYKGQWIPRKSDQLDDLVDEVLEIGFNVHTDISNIPHNEPGILDRHGLDRDEVYSKAKEGLRKLLSTWTKGYYMERLCKEEGG